MKTFSRAKLSDLLEASGQGHRMGRLVDRLANLLLMTGLLRTGLNLIVLLSVLASIRQRLPDWQPLGRYALSFVVAGVLLSVFSVAVPISWARYHPEKLLAWSIRPLEASLFLLTPMVRFLHLFDPVVRRLSGGELAESSDSPLTDDLMSVVQEHEQEGQVDQVQKQMIEALVELPTTTADQIMTPRTEVQGIEVNASLEQVRAAILEAGHSRIPVYDDNLDHIVGVLYAKDMIRFLGDDQPFELRRVLRHQPRPNLVEPAERHIEDDDGGPPAERRPVEGFGHRARHAMPGDEGDRRIDGAMGQGYPGIGEPAEAGADAGDDAERNPRLDQGEPLLAAAAEDERIAALQPQHTPAIPGMADQPAGNIGLFRRRPSAAFAGVDKLGAGPREVEDARIDQRVINHHVGLAQPVERVQRQQPRIAGARARQPHPAGLEVGELESQIIHTP